MSKQVKMLSSCLDIILAGSKKPIKNEAAYEILLQFVAYKIGAAKDIASPTLLIDVWNQLEQTLDLEMLREDIWDWFGEMYILRCSHKKITNRHFFCKREDALKDAEERMVQIRSHQLHTTLPAIIFDPYCASGRQILAYHSLYQDHDCIYYGAEYDKYAYQTCLVNMKLYDVPAKILYADTSVHEIATSSSNWEYANMWDVNMKKLKTSSTLLVDCDPRRKTK
jgi:hypothetical protein